ncbi:MAG: hypothetical protein AAF639_43620, partial [Chloroflexota bacterium]
NSQGRDAARLLFGQGDIAPLCAFVEEYLLDVYHNRDYEHFNELSLKSLFIALLFHNQLYIMDSEPALKRRYGDLIMLIRPEMRRYKVLDLLLEFKYVPLYKLKGKPSGEEVVKMERGELRQMSAVKSAFTQAEKQLKDYHKILKRKYGDVLRLRTYAVVAVGVERVFAEEVTDS